MKLKKAYYSLAILLTVAAISFSSCKKDKDEKDQNNPETVTGFITDEMSVDQAIDHTFDDIDFLMRINHEKSVYNPPCNATIDSTSVINDSITYYITYNGLSCNGKFNRTGRVEYKKKAGTHFFMQGATVVIKHINFTITRVSTGKSVTINSKKNFTNVTGGYPGLLGQSGFDTLIHKIEGQMQVSFNNGTSRLWSVAKQRTLTGENDNYTLTVEGFGTSGTYTNLVAWGTNRNGEEFYTKITQPVVFKQACDWNPVAGSKFHDIPSQDKSALVIFGYKENQPITGNECPTHFRIDWRNGTFTGTRFIAFM